MKSQFITTDYVFKHSIIESNVDADLVTKFILKAQELNIQEILGSNLYNKLVTDCPTFTGYYKTLMDNYIQPCLTEWTVYHSLPFLNYHITNKAVSQKSSENSTPSTLDDLKWLLSQVKGSAEFYSERVKDYIKNNSTQFPEYWTTENSYEIRPNVNNYSGRIYISPKNRRC